MQDSALPHGINVRARQTRKAQNSFGKPRDQYEFITTHLRHTDEKTDFALFILG